MNILLETISFESVGIQRRIKLSQLWTKSYQRVINGWFYCQKKKLELCKIDKLFDTWWIPMNSNELTETRFAALSSNDVIICLNFCSSLVTVQNEPLISDWDVAILALKRQNNASEWMQPIYRVDRDANDDLCHLHEWAMRFHHIQHNFLLKINVYKINKKQILKRTTKKQLQMWTLLNYYLFIF